MNPHKLESLLSGKGKLWLGVIWVVVLSATVVLPDIDTSIQQFRVLGELRAKLTAREGLPERTVRLEENVARVRERMKDLEAKLVPTDALMAFKQDISGWARSAQCRIRSIRPGGVAKRLLDEVLAEPSAPTNRKSKDGGWKVEEQISVVSIQGTFANLVRFLSTLDQAPTLLELTNLELHATPEGAGQLILDAHIKTFRLLDDKQS